MTESSASMIEHHVNITTADGVCDGYFVHPATGAHPAVMVWTDIMGLRQTFKDVAKRLAASGYAVLVPNPYYRHTRAPALPEGTRLSEEARKVVSPMSQALNPGTLSNDVNACIAWLDGQQAVDRSRKMGVIGYCMGGSLSVRSAIIRPDRIGAFACLHGGRLVTDQPESPHRLFDKLNARGLIAIAQNDDEKQPAVKDELRRAAAAANVTAEIEVYPAMHGWCVPDSAAYQVEQAERARGRMLALFQANL